MNRAARTSSMSGAVRSTTTAREPNANVLLRHWLPADLGVMGGISLRLVGARRQARELRRDRVQLLDSLSIRVEEKHPIELGSEECGDLGFANGLRQLVPGDNQ